MVKTRCFYLIWISISIIFGIFVVCRISTQEISLPQVVLDEKLNQECTDPNTCSGSISLKENIDLSEISKQLEGFDSFFPLSTIARLNIIASSSLDGNVFIEVTKPKYSERIRDIKVSCGNESSPRFDSKRPQKEFENINLVSIRGILSDYFFCEQPIINFAYKPLEKKIEIAPSEFVNVVVQGDKVIVTQQRFVLLELDLLTKAIILSIVFLLGLAAGNSLYFCLGKIGLFNNEK